MKRISRNPERFEAFELFSSIGRKYNYDLTNPHSKADFLKKISASIEDSCSNEQLLYGKRIEKAFAFIVSGLGGCVFLKQEDGGDIFCSNDILPPDYKIITKAGERFYVEVKNCHDDLVTKKYTLTEKYVSKLIRYSELNETPLKFAIFYSRIQKWCLLSLDSFDHDKGKYSISFPNAYARNEMFLLGDMELATTPDLIMEFVTNEDEAVKINGRIEVPFTIRNVNFFCNGNPITLKLEKNLAFYLIKYGSWIEKVTENIIVDDKLLGVRFIYSPELPSEEQIFQCIGTLSEMITKYYSYVTEGEDGITAIDIEIAPKAFSPIIPEGYKGNALPLWRFSIRPQKD